MSNNYKIEKYNINMTGYTCRNTESILKPIAVNYFFLEGVLPGMTDPEPVTVTEVS
jgi:hypothetical protein